MAMIPVIQETNRIQVGSPIPIGGSESARAFNETQEALGKAIFDLGNALDDGKQKTNYEPLARQYADEVELQMLQNSQRIKGTSSMDDRDGVDHSNQIFSSVEEKRVLMRDQLPEEAKPLYDQYIAAAKVQHVGAFMQTGAEANQAKLKTQFNEAFATIGEKVKADPSSLPVYLAQTQLLVEESDQVLNSQKDTVSREKMAGVVKGLSDKYKEVGARLSDGKSYDEAQKVLLKHAVLFEPDALAKELKEINDERYNAISRSRGDIDWNRKNSDYVETKQRADTTAALTKKFATAKTPYEQLVVEKEALALLETKKITTKDYEEAKGFRTSVNRVVDDLFESSVINQMIQEQGAISIKGKKTAVEKINEAFQKKGGITAARHSDLIQLANRLRESAGSIPRERMTEMGTYLKVMDTYAQTSITAINDDKVKREHSAAIAATQATFVKRVLSEPNTSVSSIYEAEVPKLDKALSVKGIMEKRIPGLPTINQVTPGAVERSIPQLKQDVMNASKSGDPAKLHYANEALRKALQQIPKEQK